MENHGVAVSMIFPMLKTILSKGYDPAVFCREASLDERILERVENRMTAAELERLMKAAARYTKDDYFGLHQGEMTDIQDLGVLGQVMLHSGTIGKALTAYRRHNVILCSGFNLALNIRDKNVELLLTLQGPGSLSRHCAEDMASSLVRLIGRLSSRRVPLKEVRFAHETPSDLLPYVSVFGLEPKFGREGHVLVLDRAVLDYPVLYSDARVLSIFESLAGEIREEITGEMRISGQILRWMKKCMPSFIPSLQQTADYLGVSPRTIQHKLKEEQTTYQTLSVQVRKELAMELLGKGIVPVSDIAYALHYSEPSAFQNAFKKWTGLTPGQYREQWQQKSGRQGKEDCLSDEMQLPG